jgi:hypothetical protein
MANINKSQPISTMLKLEQFGAYNPKYDYSDVLVISVAQLYEILEIQFNQTFLEHIILAGDADLVCKEEVD